MRNGADTLQHRRHRPVYLAPSAGYVQQFRGRIISNDSDNFGDDESAEDLRIPLLIDVPHDPSVRLPLVSPPSSAGSEVSRYHTGVSPSLQSSQSVSSIQGEYPTLSLIQRISRATSSICYVIMDFLLLIFVCLMGLFFHVEVEVVKHRTPGRSGRVIIQNNTVLPSTSHRYHSSDLLRPPQPASRSGISSPFLMDDMV